MTFDLLRVARNQSIDAAYHLTMLPRLLGPFARYWFNSHPRRYAPIAQRYAALIAHCVDDHVALAKAAGAMHLLRPGGWTQAHDDPNKLARALGVAEQARREAGVDYVALDSASLARKEPHLRENLAGGVHWTQPVAVNDPHALTLAYLQHFERLGRAIRAGDARSLVRHGAGWRVIKDANGNITASGVVVALGPWSVALTQRWDYRPPLFVKRGYHMHYDLSGNAMLNAPVMDASNGYMLAPMRRKIRLTTGAEFARLGSSSTPIQLSRAEPVARRLLPALGSRVDPLPWLGARPCMPDMLPVIGADTRESGIWYCFGHGHQGLTLGPTTGRLLAELMTGNQPFTDPTAYRPDRF